MWTGFIYLYIDKFVLFFIFFLAKNKKEANKKKIFICLVNLTHSLLIFFTFFSFCFETHSARQIVFTSLCFVFFYLLFFGKVHTHIYIPILSSWWLAHFSYFLFFFPIWMNGYMFYIWQFFFSFWLKFMNKKRKTLNFSTMKQFSK